MASHMILTSNSDMDLFPSNNASDFTTVLREPLDLSDATYELALSELQFINAIPTLQDKTFEIGKSEAGTEGYVWRDIVIDTGSLSSVTDLVTAINASLRKRRITKLNVAFIFDPATFRVKVTIGNNYAVRIPQEWARVMGFSAESFTQTTQGQYSADLHQGVHSLHVFSDISEKIPVGNRSQSLLGIVGIPNGSRSIADVVIKSFENPMYVKITEQRVQTIRIYITDESGNPIHFKIEPLTVRLSLRKAPLL